MNRADRARTRCLRRHRLAHVQPSGYGTAIARCRCGKRIERQSPTLAYLAHVDHLAVALQLAGNLT